MPGPDWTPARPPDERPGLGKEDYVQCPQLIDVVKLISAANAPVMGSPEPSEKLNTPDRLDD
jgi:hypothetical protein